MGENHNASYSTQNDESLKKQEAIKMLATLIRKYANEKSQSNKNNQEG